jgi:hypothetical protein
MSVPIWAALITAVGFLAAIYLRFLLRGRAQRSVEMRRTLQAQLNRVYGPIYDLLRDTVPPDEPTAIEDEEVEEIIEIAVSNRKLLEPRLESIIDSLKDDLSIHGEIDDRDLEDLWWHVNRKYNNLKKALGLPHTRHRTNRSLLHLYELAARSWWSAYKWEREMRRRKRRSPHRLE